MESEGAGMDGHFDASVISDSHTIDFRHLLAWYIYSAGVRCGRRGSSFVWDHAALMSDQENMRARH